MARAGAAGTSRRGSTYGHEYGDVISMINKELSFDLPIPWEQKKFKTPQIGAINFLVGPNGSVKDHGISPL